MIFLGPGEYVFGQLDEHISTILGSCVSLVTWCPENKIISVSHIMLPRLPDGELKSLRYGNVVMERWLNDVYASNLKPSDFFIGLFGGSSGFYSAAEYERSVGYRNVLALKEEVGCLGLYIRFDETGGQYHRKILVDASSGRFWWQKLGDPQHSEVKEGAW